MKKYCQYCGEELDINSIFCTKCGIQVMEKDEELQENLCPYKTMDELKAWYIYQTMNYELPVECLFDRVSYKPHSYYTINRNNAFLVFYLNESSNLSMLFNGYEEEEAVCSLYKELNKHYGLDETDPVIIKNNLHYYLSINDDGIFMNSEKPCPHCGTTITRETIYCPKCKHLVSYNGQRNLSSRADSINNKMQESDILIGKTSRSMMEFSFRMEFLAFAIIFILFFGGLAFVIGTRGLTVSKPIYGNPNLEKWEQTFVTEVNRIHKKPFGTFDNLELDAYYVGKTQGLYYYDYNEYADTYSWYMCTMSVRGTSTWKCIANNTEEKYKPVSIYNKPYASLSNVFANYNFAVEITDVTLSDDWEEMHGGME